MADHVPQPSDMDGIPTVEELRKIGRERLMTYFAGSGMTPPEDLDEMARVAHELIVKEAAEGEAWWNEALKRNDWVPMEQVLKELGIDTSEGSANEPAA
jgi:hypothetical protein